MLVQFADGSTGLHDADTRSLPSRAATEGRCQRGHRARRVTRHHRNLTRQPTFVAQKRVTEVRDPDLLWQRVGESECGQHLPWLAREGRLCRRSPPPGWHRNADGLEIRAKRVRTAGCGRTCSRNLRVSGSVFLAGSPALSWIEAKSCWVGEAGQQRDEHLRVGGSPAGYRVPSGSGRVAVGAGCVGCDVVKCSVVAGAAGDAVDRGVDEAEVVMGVLVGQRHKPSPQRRGVARPGGRNGAMLCHPPVKTSAMPPTSAASPATSGTPRASEIPATPSW